MVEFDLKLHGFRKECTYINTLIKTRIGITYLKAITTALTTLAISSFKQAKCCNICPLRILKISNKIMFCLPANQHAFQPTCQQNWPRAYTAMYVTFKHSKNKDYFCYHKFWLQYVLDVRHCLSFVHSF